MKKITFFTIIALLLVSVSITSISAQNQYEIPSWVKGVAGFWAEGKISDGDFGEGLAFLIDNEIIKVPKIQELQDKVSTLQSENADLRSKLNLPEQDEGDSVSNSITVSTDKLRYNDGDTILVTGKVGSILPRIDGVKVPASLRVEAPNGNLVSVAQIDVGSDKKFSIKLTAGGEIMRTEGTYTIKIIYGGESRTAQTTFTFSSLTSGDSQTCPSGQTLINGKCVFPITISVTTDKSKYNEGDTILVSGKVSDLLSEFIPVTLMVIAPNGETVSIEQFDVGSDKKFSIEIITGGAMKSAGTYTVKVSYGGDTTSLAKTTFTFSGSTGTIPSKEGTTIAVPGTDFIVSYKITGGKLISITPDVVQHSLTIAITASQDGSLVITLPRALIDTSFVLIDWKQVGFEATTTSTDRTLTIQFPAGANTIGIIGTFVVS